MITAETIGEIFTNPRKAEAKFAQEPERELTPKMLNHIVGLLDEGSRGDAEGPEDPIMAEIRESFRRGSK